MIQLLVFLVVLGSILIPPASDAGATEPNACTPGINALGVRVVDAIRTAHPDDNVFISGLSLHEAVSMLYVGSEGATRAELAALLGLDEATASA